VAAGKKYGALFKKGRIIKRIKEKDFVKEIIKAVRAEKLSTES
jgi:4-hydroxy-3-methylbut-2-en-1-yl diphosphate synthase IspG/GcpE